MEEDFNFTLVPEDEEEEGVILPQEEEERQQTSSFSLFPVEEEEERPTLQSGPALIPLPVSQEELDRDISIDLSEVEGVIEAVEPELGRPSPRVVPTASGFLELDNILAEYDRELLEEDFLSDPRLQEIMIEVLEARGRGLSKTAQTALGAAGGATFGRGSNLRAMEPEEVFRMFQAYQRKMISAHSVTLANEIAFSLGASDEDLAKLGAGYILFDAMEGVFGSERRSLSEISSAIYDYGVNAVFDPINLATLGIGRGMAIPAQKASVAATRNVMIRAYRRKLSQGATGRVALASVGLATAAAPYMAADVGLNVGLDVAYQFQLMRSDAQEEYNKAQTALTAAGTMAIPALIASFKGAGALRKGALKDTFLGAADVDFLSKNLSTEEVWSQVTDRVQVNQVIDFVDDQFGRIEGDTSLFLNWGQAKKVANEIVDEKGERLTDASVLNMFEKYFWFGAPDSAEGGYFNALQNAGFVVHPSMLRDNTNSGVYGQAITFLSDEAAEKVVRNFEAATGRQLGITPTADGLASHFISRSEDLGVGLGIRSMLSRAERQGLTGRELAEAAAGVGARDDSPEVAQFGLSVYKRLLTSHLATTGANIKGFTQLVSIDSLADIFSAATYATQSAFYRTLNKNPELATQYANYALASLHSPGRRAAGVFSPDMDMAYTDMILSLSPDAKKKLFRDLAGDSGPRQALTQFNIDPDNKLASTVDAATRGAQTLTLVNMQDSLTKRWAFAPNLDREIRRQYGVSSQDFWARPDAALEMQSDTFKFALDRAVYRTQRQTASVNWSTLPGRDGMRGAAKTFEDFVNREATGLSVIIPFPSFMNTTVATLADLSGVNLMARLVGASRGRQLDYADQDFGELMGKTAAGLTIMALAVPDAIERIQNGYSWNQEVRETGEVFDETFNWPASTIRLTAQIIAHGLVGENISSDPAELYNQVSNGDVIFDRTQVPRELTREFFLQAGPAQAMRDFEGSVSALRDVVNAGLSGEDDLGEALMDLVAMTLARPIQGVTRPLDPLNVGVGLLRDGNMNPDLRQGPQNFNQMSRYFNQLFPALSGVDDLPRRATPLRGTETRVDPGRQIFGQRTTNQNNIAEMMFNSAGIPSWRSVRWDGPAEVKNYMDGLAAPIFEAEALKAYRANPDFHDMSTEKKRLIVLGVQDSTRKKVYDLMSTQGVPKTLDLVRRLSSADPIRMRRLADHFGYERDLSELLKREDAFEVLHKMKYYIDNYDSIFHGELELGR